MFQCYSASSVQFQPSQKVSQGHSYADSVSQTNDLPRHSISIQTHERVDAQVQSTDSVAPAPANQQNILESSLLAQDSNSIFKRFEKKEIDKLSLFLRSIEPVVSRALLANSRRTSAPTNPALQFSNHRFNSTEELSLESNEHQMKTQIRCLLYPTNLFSNQPPPSITSTISPSNHTRRLSPLQIKFAGLRLCSYLYIAYGYPSHQDEGWCAHRGYLVGWDLSVPQHRVNCTRPDLVLETQSCLGSISVHSADQNIVAGGTFAGEILIWDIRRLDMGKDALIFCGGGSSEKRSGVNADLESNEPVVAVDWLPSSNKSSYSLLVAAQRNGIMSVYQVDTQNYVVQLLKRFTLAAIVDVFRAAQPDITSMTVDASKDYTCINSAVVYIGTNCGHVLSLDIPAILQPTAAPIKPFTLFSNNQVSTKTNSRTSSNFFFKSKGAPHAGPVTTLSALNGFLASGSSDGRLLVWQALKPYSPQWTIYPSSNIGRSIKNIELGTMETMLEIWVQDDQAQVVQYLLKTVTNENQETFTIKKVYNCSLKGRDMDSQYQQQDGITDLSKLVEFEEVDNEPVGVLSSAIKCSALSMSTESCTMMAVGDSFGRVLVLNKSR